MTFKNILDINQGIMILKNNNIKFKIKIANKLLINLKNTDIIINEQNKVINELSKKYSSFDGYSYVINDKINEYQKDYNEIINQEINEDSIGIIKIDEHELCDYEFDISTFELIKPIINISST